MVEPRKLRRRTGFRPTVSDIMLRNGELKAWLRKKADDYVTIRKTGLLPDDKSLTYQGSNIISNLTLFSMSDSDISNELLMRR